MPGSLTIDESRQLMRVTQRLCRPPRPGGLLADAGLAEDLAGLFQADFIGSTRWNPERRAFEDAVCVGRGREMAQQYVQQFQFDDPISPKARLRREPTLIHAIVPRQELMRTRYYGEFLLPFKTVDGIDLYLYQGTHNVGDLRLWRGPGRPPLGAHEVALLDLLRPYLLNAMLSFGELAAPGGGLDAAATEHCAWPCFADAPQRGVQPANPAAERLLRDLCAADADDLCSRIHRVALAGRPSAWDEFTLCVARADDSATRLVQLVPVLSSTGAAQGLERSFGLTPREAQICLQLAAGRSDDQIAAALGISYWTVRSHLRKVFTKFDVGNRVELTRMLMTPNP
ncbi:helix-turn-helix transcriptional regulator [Aquabacterium sp.]|uniref:helix-turn-helix transcriptional regulator n=1 Tax=Aquabacterium sp. TaxID=1872578 RepID=UPI002CE1FEC1|nr:LuxR C-terminal-related transcriptional regulator [Aquabacterium sp.]HSW03586.1 LuxR C-terminal-related transcriptional regulator [Aquabacterium sp.]